MHGRAASAVFESVVPRSGERVHAVRPTEDTTFHPDGGGSRFPLCLRPGGWPTEMQSWQDNANASCSGAIASREASLTGTTLVSYRHYPAKQDSMTLTVVRITGQPSGLSRNEIQRSYQRAAVRHAGLHARLVDLAKHVQQASRVIINTICITADRFIGCAASLRDAGCQSLVGGEHLSEAGRRDAARDRRGMRPVPRRGSDRSRRRRRAVRAAYRALQLQAWFGHRPR